MKRKRKQKKIENKKSRRRHTRCSGVLWVRKQKTAYEMLRSLVGSQAEDGIRDAQESRGLGDVYKRQGRTPGAARRARRSPGHRPARPACLLYTSDAADDLTRVDLGGRRIIKKKNNIFFQAEDGIRDAQESRGLGDVYKRQGRTPGAARRARRSPGHRPARP